jgi:hypothetical protein
MMPLTLVILQFENLIRVLYTGLCYVVSVRKSFLSSVIFGVIFDNFLVLEMHNNGIFVQLQISDFYKFVF